MGATSVAVVVASSSFNGIMNNSMRLLLGQQHQGMVSLRQLLIHNHRPSQQVGRSYCYALRRPKVVTTTTLRPNCRHDYLMLPPPSRQQQLHTNWRFRPLVGTRPTTTPLASLSFSPLLEQSGGIGMTPTPLPQPALLLYGTTTKSSFSRGHSSNNNNNSTPLLRRPFMVARPPSSLDHIAVRNNNNNMTMIGSLSYFSSYNNNNNNGDKGPSSSHQSSMTTPGGPQIPPPPPPPRRSLGGMAGLVGTGAIVLFGKTKYVLAALKVTKLASLGSMVLTVGTYSMFFGLPYAVGMVGLILIHEIGHAAVMYQKGVPFSPMVFVPFMGAVIAMRDHPRDAWEDALIAFGGPVLGSVGALGVCLAGHMTESQLLIALADFGFMINLFNLLPIGSMDGGRIAGALSPYMNVAGLGMGVSAAYMGLIHNPVFYLILLAGGYDTFQRLFNPAGHHVPPSYYKITPTQRLTIGLGYAGLIGSLALAMDINERYKKSPEVLRRERDSMEKSWDMTT